MKLKQENKTLEKTALAGVIRTEKIEGKQTNTDLYKAMVFEPGVPAYPHCSRHSPYAEQTK